MTACIIPLWDGRLDAFESLEGIFNMASPGLGQEDLTRADMPHSLNVTLGLFLHEDSTCAQQPGVQRFSFFLLSAQAKALTPRLILLAPSTLMYFPKIYGKRPVWSHYNIRNCMVFMETRVSRTIKHVHTSSAGSVLENKVCDS